LNGQNSKEGGYEQGEKDVQKRGLQTLPLLPNAPIAKKGMF